MASRARLLAPITLAALGAAAALSLVRVFDGSGFVLPVIAAALLPYVVGAIGRHRSWPTAVTVSAGLLALVVYVVYALEPSTTTSGAPLVDTWTTIAHQLDHGWHTLRTTPAPAPVTDGAVLLAVIVTWIMAMCSDWLAFVRRAVLGALAPALVLFVWSSTLGTKDDWELSVAAFAVLSGCFLYAQNLALLDRRRSWLVTRGATRAPSLVPTTVVAILAVLGALVIAPAIPGAGADPILDFNTANGTQAGGKSYRASIAPLVDVGQKLRNIDIPDLFTVQSPQRDYWRVTALDEYSAEGGGQWTLNAAGDGKVQVGLPSTVPANAVRQVYTISRLGERWLPAAYRPVSITLSDTLVVVSSWTLVTSEPSVEGLTYTVGSIIGPTADQITPAQQAATAAAVPSTIKQYEALPADFPTEITTLAQQIVAGATTPYAKAKALRDFFRDPSFVYDTSVDLGDDANAIETFLRQRRGFCVQFASAYSVMARAVGLPTRLAVGYTPGTQNGDTYTIGSHDAHAWPEVWLAGLGWTHLFDPTPASGTATAGGSQLPGEVPVTATPVAGQQTPATLPPVANTPTGTGAGTAPSGSNGTGVTTPGGAAAGTAVPPTTAAPLAPSVSTTVASDSSVWSVVALVAGSIALIVGAYVVTVVMLKRRRRARRRDAEPAIAVQGAWDEALDRLQEARLRADPALTPLELARVTPTRTTPETARPMRALARTYTTTRYGERPPAPDDARQAWDSVDELERALDEHLTFRERWRRRLDPSTLRVPAGSRHD
jgi:transglutaminase-like putative cysteine protease